MAIQHSFGGSAHECAGDDRQRGRHTADAFRRNWQPAFAGLVLAGFVPLYLLTRRQFLIGDGDFFASMVRLGDPAQQQYGELSHFLQVPLTRGLWQVLETLGLPVSPEAIALGICLAGNLAAIIFVGLIAAELLQTRTAAWLAAVLFGTSLLGWVHWNGELYALALGFLAAGLYFALRGRIVIAALLWALSMLSHLEFALATPAFMAAVWMGETEGVTTRKLQRTLSLLLIAGAATAIALLAGAWVIGKWQDMPSLIAWFWRAYETRDSDVGRPEVVRAVYGLLSAYSVAGHYWRDIMTGRGAFGEPLFVAATGVGLVVLAATGILLAAVRRRGLVLFGLAWLLPFHILFNWWFLSATEKYHAGALPGLVLLVTGGLVQLGRHMPAQGARWLFVAYVAVFAGLNLFGSVLPMKAMAEDTVRAQGELRQLSQEQSDRAVLVSCDNPRAVSGAGVPFLRVRAVYKGSAAEIQETILSWVRVQVSEGKQPYVLGRWCRPDEWMTSWSKEPFDLYFLEQHFQLVPTPITGVPIAEPQPSNPFSWRRGDVAQIVAKR